MPSTSPIAPCDFVVFGGTGDLTVRKLLPALYLRDRDGQLPDDTRIIAVSRAGLDAAGYRDKVHGELERFVTSDALDEAVVDRFLRRLEFAGIDAADGSTWEPLTALLPREADRIRVYYLACAPRLFGPISENLAANGLVDQHSRVVLEKPIGHDLESARAINDAVGAVFDESQIFRIDHYLGKESVQNLLVTRFANTVLEPLWNSTSIDHVQITVSEEIGVGSRGEYYDTSGALRDMVQNHLLQVLCLVAMEPPTYVDRESVRDEKLKVLQALKPMTPEDAERDTVAGQYGPGLVNGVAVPGYRDEADNADSRTETFVAVKAEVRNWRWAGVPFYLRTGKRMERRHSEVVIAFNPVPHPMFPGSEGTSEPNRLVIRLQPTEGMRLHMTAKEPGPGGIRLRPVSLDLNYTEVFPHPSPDAYERLLMDVVRGNPTLFMRRDEVEAAWTWVEPILANWARTERVPRRYPAGTDGPVDAVTLIERDGRTWNEGALR
ncbi:Glucose-6-phosphate 1-dehydrogenase OS=Tsukamurella paurometabola (strain ATCC 8368 / DSM /CCUG 35730 / CIP 100753 / JCM 10117 / KCTC 9821 / NBRC 16120/ NCIMB 702349 / NCTC 13040) OX=521096 GN=zwf PE=3 SV=1 [Tsukamurella paurometabola]|uniref:Glucose-6-phosphate 1-dehydrogenase n=1 Tax=Tsukamurella paurometabola (strain ATCC 8368 / DSM 20162 / CCUG 35730 / CIP 100753 / JCM 10117 / KCTC 9821 / NBRC 16120 / NCIMB 702349 / NCTC 13040) TaxID=521096 RepID=D5UP66_TSUPD|nr:glucose-6-phosphate dehydrogenase [Tsukamurella paurometabola]ADG80775.1 glucose-6-phosphate 1-dehydrogenase [Tsukamurella paurometabola DSM 20162]SUP40936.1 Glucose-6-phosphate 1-dehydrogenase [Tsukamurella paurometabola]